MPGHSILVLGPASNRKCLKRLLTRIAPALPSLQALSPVGRCKTFDASADGYGRGEGFAAIVLTQHRGGSDSGGSGAALLAVVHGSAVNTAGRSSGLTAPNGPAQHKLLAAALAAGRAGPADVAYLAVHGTGTPLGDPIGKPCPTSAEVSRSFSSGCPSGT